MPASRDSQRKPVPKHEQYISWLYHNIDKSYIPEAEQFQVQSIRSLNVKNKLCELKDVQDCTFHDLIVQVVQEPYDLGDKVRLYVSDYTENSKFFHYMWKGQAREVCKDGDPYGYTSARTDKAGTSADNWSGPFGKRSLQVTCYEPHAAIIRERVKLGSWVHLLNVHIKYGSNQQNLEGYLRQDRGAFPNKVYVDVLVPPDDPESMNPNMKNAIRRKRDYEKELKAQHKELQSTQGTTKKRSATDQPEEKRLNSKQRRAQQRAQAAGKAQKDTPTEAPPDLNPRVVSENQEQIIVPVSTILELATYETTVQGGHPIVKLPFTCARYRTNVRVVDFHPPRLQNFACPVKQTEYDVLSDYSGTDSESEVEDQGTLDGFVGECNWEWRFALRLQDAAAGKDQKSHKDSSFWVLVDNMEAQLLTGLDACNFRANPEALAQLRERMFILWGDLEEKKSKELLDNIKKPKARAGKKLTGERPPLDSSDDEVASRPGKEATAKQAISNRPFTCCIRQYGVQVRESNSAKADAGKGKRWERVFGLFGTKISGV